jgi:deaminated glutathione amidase
MAQPVVTGLIQTCSGIDPTRNVAQLTPMIAKAAANGAQLVVLPEGANLLDRDPARFAVTLAEGGTQASLAAFASLAARHGIWLLAGSLILPGSKPGKAVNRSCLFDPDGQQVASYDKIHLFDVDLGGGEVYRESNSFEPGRQACLADMDGVGLGLTICYDLRFAALYRALAQAGADIITVPAAFTVPTGKAHWLTLLRARAIETGSYVLAAAQGGLHEDGRQTYGHSCVIGPWGEVVAGLAHDQPGVLMAELDLDQVRDARRRMPAWTTDPDWVGPQKVGRTAITRKTPAGRA